MTSLYRNFYIKAFLLTSLFNFLKRKLDLIDEFDYDSISKKAERISKSSSNKEREILIDYNDKITNVINESIDKSSFKFSDLIREWNRVKPTSIKDLQPEKWAEILGRQDNTLIPTIEVDPELEETLAEV